MSSNEVMYVVVLSNVGKGRFDVLYTTKDEEVATLIQEEVSKVITYNDGTYDIYVSEVPYIKGLPEYMAAKERGEVF